MDISYQLIRSDRKTISLQILGNGALVVRCPKRMPDAQVRAFVNSKRNWLQKHLSKHSLPVEPFTHDQLQKMAQQTKQILLPRLAYYSKLLGVQYGKVTVRAQRTRWGSCSGKGNLNFNCLLSLMPSEVVDYVVVHELCHLKEMNHSKAFWELVASCMPEYSGCRKWLKEHGGLLIARLDRR